MSLRKYDSLTSETDNSTSEKAVVYNQGVYRAQPKQTNRRNLIVGTRDHAQLRRSMKLHALILVC
ncbi:hypothetical protein NECAME_18403 [Necator americanus]|uniref:Uncharacterized protein n=1 Tax=Necator americanus TaxID=51031 RepID=W2SU87_NECAM|nr:hypothetical protein NECAME_18403 [Necator americanus]ETN73289.1 hypothetical protein NECAME_18403 [Necator americanus]